MKAKNEKPSLLELCEVYQRQNVLRDTKYKEATSSGRAQPGSQMASTSGKKVAVKCLTNSANESDSILCSHSLNQRLSLVKIQALNKVNNGCASDSGVVALQSSSPLANYKYAFPIMAEAQETTKVRSGYKADPTAIHSPPCQSSVSNCQKSIFSSCSEVHSPSLRSGSYHFPTAAENNSDRYSLIPVAKPRLRLVKIQAPNKVNNGYASDFEVLSPQSSSPSPLAKYKYTFPAIANVQETTEVRSGYKADPTGIHSPPPSRSPVPNCQKFLFPSCSEVHLPSTEANSILRSESQNFPTAAANNYDRERRSNLENFFSHNLERGGTKNEDCEYNQPILVASPTRQSEYWFSRYEPRPPSSLKEQRKTIHDRERMTTKSRGLDQLLPTQKSSVLSSGLNQYAAMRDRRFGGQVIYQKTAAAVWPTNLQRNTAHGQEITNTEDTLHRQLPPTQQLCVISSHCNNHAVVADCERGQETFQDVVAAETSTGTAEKTAPLQREKMSTTNTVHDQLPPTQQQSKISLNLRKQSCKGGRQFFRQDICQGMVAADGSRTAKRNTDNHRVIMVTRNIVHYQLPTHQQFAMPSHLNQQSDRGRDRFSQQEVGQEMSRRERRHGVCDYSDGARAERVFARVFKKRF